MNYSQRLKVVEDHKRCMRCLGPSCPSVEKCRFQKGPPCEYCQLPIHHNRLHDFDKECQEVVTINCARGHYGTGVHQQYSESSPYEAYRFSGIKALTISYDVIELGSPVTGKWVKINCIRDGGCSQTLIHIGVARYLGLVGPEHKRQTKGVSGMVWNHVVTTCMVRLRSSSGDHCEMLPLNFTDSPCHGLKMVDWRNFLSFHEEFKPLEGQLPVPADPQEGIDEIAGVLGQDLPHLILRQDNSKPGPSQYGGLGWMKPLAVRTLLGWSISGYTSRTPPERSDIAEARLTLNDSFLLAFPTISGGDNNIQALTL